MRRRTPCTRLWWWTGRCCADPRDVATGHHVDVPGAGVAVNTAGEGGVLPNEEVGGDSTGKREGLILGAGDLAENTLRLLLVAARSGAHDVVTACPLQCICCLSCDVHKGV